MEHSRIRFSAELFGVKSPSWSAIALYQTVDQNDVDDTPTLRALMRGSSAKLTMYVNGTTAPSATMQVQWTQLQYSMEEGGGWQPVTRPPLLESLQPLVPER